MICSQIAFKSSPTTRLFVNVQNKGFWFENSTKKTFAFARSSHDLDDKAIHQSTTGGQRNLPFAEVVGKGLKASYAENQTSIIKLYRAGKENYLTVGGTSTPPGVGEGWCAVVPSVSNASRKLFTIATFISQIRNITLHKELKSMFVQPVAPQIL